MDCWFCGHEVIWSGDFDYEDFELGGEGIVTVMSCSNCNAQWEGYLPLNEEEDNIGE